MTEAGAAGIPPKEWVMEVRRVLSCESRALLDCEARLGLAEPGRAIGQALERMSDSLERGGKIVVTGVGKSGKVAQKIAATFCSTGSLAVFLHPTEGLHGDLGLIRSDDILLALSYTGNTEELVRLLPSIRARGVPVVGIGGNPASRLASHCDVWIDGSVAQEACPHNLAPTASTTLALALGDALAVALMQIRGFDARAFALNHPGGSLGNRLNLRVADLMHRGESVPTVGSEAFMEEVIGVSTRGKLGAVLVVDGPKLEGIITDGDLRRALRHREGFFKLRAGEVMTRSPVTVAPEAMAKAALDLMENRPSQISALPVVDEAGHWKGLVRLHDLVRAF